MTIAYCDRTGVIGFTDGSCPKGSLPISKMADEQFLRDKIASLARYAYDNKTMIVPGVPEAQTTEAALEALFKFREAVNTTV